MIKRYIVKQVIHLKDEFCNIDEYTYFYVGVETLDYGFLKGCYKFGFSNNIVDAIILKNEEQAEELIKVLKRIYPKYTFIKEEL